MCCSCRFVVFTYDILAALCTMQSASSDWLHFAAGIRLLPTFPHNLELCRLFRHADQHYLTPDARTMKQIIEQFQMAYTCTDALRLERPHALSDNNQTKITKHTAENLGMSVRHVAQELGHKCETVCTTLKKKGVSLSNFHVA